MYDIPDQQVDAVHLAVALNYYGLLRLPLMSEASEVEICTFHGIMQNSLVAKLTTLFTFFSTDEPSHRPRHTELHPPHHPLYPTVPTYGSQRSTTVHLRCVHGRRSPGR